MHLSLSSTAAFASVTVVVAFLIPVDGLRYRSGVKEKKCYQCAWSPPKLAYATVKKPIYYSTVVDHYGAPSDTGVTYGSKKQVPVKVQGGWDKCQKSFTRKQARGFGIDEWECDSNCYTRTDKNGNLYRGCYKGEYDVNPHKLGCSYQAGSRYCFCAGSLCNNAHAPPYKSSGFQSKDYSGKIWAKSGTYEPTSMYSTSTDFDKYDITEDSDYDKKFGTYDSSYDTYGSKYDTRGYDTKYDSKHDEKYGTKLYDSKYDKGYDTKYDSKYDKKYDGKYDRDYGGKYDSKYDNTYRYIRKYFMKKGADYDDKYSPKYDAKYMKHAGKYYKTYKDGDGNKYFGKYDTKYKYDRSYDEKDQSKYDDEYDSKYDKYHDDDSRYDVDSDYDDKYYDMKAAYRRLYSSKGDAGYQVHDHKAGYHNDDDDDDYNDDPGYGYVKRERSSRPRSRRGYTSKYSYDRSDDDSKHRGRHYRKRQAGYLGDEMRSDRYRKRPSKDDDRYEEDHRGAYSSKSRGRYGGYRRPTYLTKRGRSRYEKSY